MMNDAWRYRHSRHSTTLPANCLKECTIIIASYHVFKFCRTRSPVTSKNAMWHRNSAISRQTCIISTIPTQNGFRITCSNKKRHFTNLEAASTNQDIGKHDIFSIHSVPRKYWWLHWLASHWFTATHTHRLNFQLWHKRGQILQNRTRWKSLN